MSVIIRLVDRDSDLRGIQELQTRNLRRNISESEASEFGFLIAEFDLEFLRLMNRSRPSIVAVAGGQVVGYAVVATKAIRDGNPLLTALFDQIDLLEFQGRCLAAADYVVVGQLCVGKKYRGQGLVPRLYQHFRSSLEAEHPCAITEVAKANLRSFRAHRKVGFETIHVMVYEGLEWEVVLWDWTHV